MAILYVDGFDTYGSDANNMLTGNWAEVRANVDIQSPGRNGTGALRINDNAVFNIARIVFPLTSLTDFGIGVAYMMDELPSSGGSTEYNVYQISDANNLGQFFLTVTTTGSLRVTNGAGYINLSDPAIVAGAWHHIEAKVTVGAMGSYEVRVDGVPVLSDTGVNTDPQGTGEVSQASFGVSTQTADLGPTILFDDLFIWDTTGTINNDFFGDSIAQLVLPDGDTVLADFAITGAATGWEAIDEVPTDGDTTYIEAALVNDQSQFTLGDLGVDVSTIHAVQINNTSRKTDAGVANLQTAIVSGASVATGADRPLTENYVTRTDVIETDPNTGVKFTRSGFNAAEVRVEKTA